MFENKLSQVVGWVSGGWLGGGWLDQLKIRLTSAKAFVELGLELCLAIITYYEYIIISRKIFCQDCGQDSVEPLNSRSEKM